MMLKSALGLRQIRGVGAICCAWRGQFHGRFGSARWTTSGSSSTQQTPRCSVAEASGNNDRGSPARYDGSRLLRRNAVRGVLLEPGVVAAAAGRVPTTARVHEAPGRL